MTQRTSPLARYGALPRGLDREEAAAYVGISAWKFMQLVTDGRMPQAIQIDGRVLWDRAALDAAFDRLNAKPETPDAQPDDVWARAAV
ncbi:MAG: hypothetical protein RL291_692 [Pseudomonadota bacterium]|jgi:predicted DNA-binding transcriptional regulator AlpA